MLSQNNYKIKKKFYCLYKKGKKYVVKKKEKENNENNNLKEIKGEENIEIKNLKKLIHKNFNSKYNNMPNKYNFLLVK